jgi:hypothetical protein
VKKHENSVAKGNAAADQACIGPILGTAASSDD